MEKTKRTLCWRQEQDIKLCREKMMMSGFFRHSARCQSSFLELAWGHKSREEMPTTSTITFSLPGSKRPILILVIFFLHCLWVRSGLLWPRRRVRMILWGHLSLPNSSPYKTFHSFSASNSSDRRFWAPRNWLGNYHCFGELITSLFWQWIIKVFRHSCCLLRNIGCFLRTSISESYTHNNRFL